MPLKYMDLQTTLWYQDCKVQQNKLQKLLTKKEIIGIALTDYTKKIAY